MASKKDTLRGARKEKPSSETATTASVVQSEPEDQRRTPCDSAETGATGKDTLPHPDDRSRTTLFVSTLPYNAGSEQLQEFFSEIGPVRSCYVVADKNAQEGAFKNMGYGYVTYALPEDAARALKELKKARFMGTRTLKMEFAYKKRVAQERNAVGLPLEGDIRPLKQKRKQALEPCRPGRSTIDYRRPTTILISGLGAAVTKKNVYKKARKFGDVIEVVYPVVENEQQVSGQARVVYSAGQDADNAIRHLDGHQFKGVKIRARNISEEQREARRARLIIRNLPWQCSNEHLHKIFAQHGTVVECVIPKADDGKAKGFGFVQLSATSEAEKAIEQLNGSKIMGRPVAVDWALPKAHYERAIEDEDEQDEGAIGDASDDSAEVHMPNDVTGDERRATSAEKDARVIDDENDEGCDSGLDRGAEDDSSVDGPGDGYWSNGIENEGTKNSKHKGNVDTKRAQADDVQPDAKTRRGTQARADHDLQASVEDCCTLFIRNLSFDTTQKELADAFTAFGQLRYARLTMDSATGRSRGTGFVCFRKREDAAACLAANERASKAAGLLHEGAEDEKSDSKKAKLLKNLQPAKSILTPEPSLTAGAAPFVIGGRFLNVSLAVDRQVAAKLAEEGKLRRRAEDKRNMYLIREGVIFPDSDAAKSMTPSELSKRQESFAQRKRLLATNPNLYISRTRLSVRNLGLRVDDKELKSVAIGAVKEFWNEVQRGERQGMEAEVIKEEENEGRQVPSAARKPCLKQAKVLRSKDRIDGTTKLPRSLGYGFVEFTSHADALACLRWMNNNPRAFAPTPTHDESQVTDASTQTARGKRPIVEFSIENRQVVKRREEREKTLKRKREDEKDAGTGRPAKKSFKERWKERRLAMKTKEKAKQPKEDGTLDTKKQTRKSFKPKASGRLAAEPNLVKASKRKHENDDLKKAKKKVALGKERERGPKAPSPVGKQSIAIISPPDEALNPKVSKGKKSKPTKSQRRDEKEARQFDSLVQKYKRNLFGNAAETASKSGMKRSFA